MKQVPRHYIGHRLLKLFNELSPFEEIFVNSDLEDCGFDSLDKVESSFLIEGMFDIKFKDHDPMNNTVAEITEQVHGLIVEKEST